MKDAITIVKEEFFLMRHEMNHPFSNSRDLNEEQLDALEARIESRLMQETVEVSELWTRSVENERRTRAVENLESCPGSPTSPRCIFCRDNTKGIYAGDTRVFNTWTGSYMDLQQVHACDKHRGALVSPKLSAPV